jgi:hypothetical protein
MKRSKRVRVATACVQALASVVLIGAGTPEALADAKLLHFDRPANERVPGQYYVLFKTEQELRQLPSFFVDPGPESKSRRYCRTIFQPPQQPAVPWLRHWPRRFTAM